MNPSRKCRSLLLSSLALAAAGPAAAAKAESPPIACGSAGVACVQPAKSCKASNSTTVRRNGLARLYSQGANGSEQLRGCLRSRGIARSVKLAENFDDGLYETTTWDRVRLWDRFASRRQTRTDTSCKADCPPGYGFWQTRLVRDLKTGESRRRPASFNLGAAYVLTTTRIATAVRAGDAVELRTWDGKKSKVVASGDIELRSLAADGNRVHWVQEGAERSARL